MLLTIIMGVFNLLFGCAQSGGERRFKSPQEYNEIRDHQIATVSQTINQLRKYGIKDQTVQKLQYYFYTNTEKKAAALCQGLATLGYQGKYDRSASDKRLFAIIGETSPMRMDGQTVLDWTIRMCDLGQEYDCEYDGWATEVPQTGGS